MKRINSIDTSIASELDVFEGCLLGDYIIKCITQGTSPEIVGALEYDEEETPYYDVDPNADPRTDFWDAVEQLDDIQRKQIVKDKQLENDPVSSSDSSSGNLADSESAE